QSGKVNVRAQGEHAARMYAAGMRVFMPAAGTSEFHSLSADEIVEIIRVTREASGPDAQIFAPVGLQLSHAIDIGKRSVAAGATGYTTGAGNICPNLTLAMHAAFAAGEFAEGMRLQQLILPIEDFRAREGDSFNISMLKHALKMVGHDFGPPRAPQRQLTAQD